MGTRVLAIDDDQATCEMLEDGLKPLGFNVQWATEGARALEMVNGANFDVVIADLNLGSMSGLDLCRSLSERQPNVPVIVITAYGSMDSAIAAIRVGAHDFITKPFEIRALAHSLERAAQHRRLREEVKRLKLEAGQAKGAGTLIGESAPMRRVYELIHRVANTDASVLITGESGTGKELVARALHSESSRRDMPFVAINCAAVPVQLLESELFGHVKGAFTDAKSARVGLFQQADGGTLLLDEIGEMPIEMQAKLLRVLQEKTVRPVGGGAELPFDTRVITATNRDLETEVEEGRFREDLYYRLNVVQIHVPPLRARGGDVLVLAQHFIQKIAKRTGKPVSGVSPEAAQKLLEYDWPGNVRQLENWMERAVTLTSFDSITIDDLPKKIREYQPTPASSVDVDVEHILPLEEVEKRYIERVLRAVEGNKSQAAKALGLDRRTLYRKLQRYEQGS